MRILILDNYDSFTFNLFQMLATAAGAVPDVWLNDRCTWEEIEAAGHDAIVVSPGPGRPGRIADFGVCGEVLRRAEVPLLGVCLGHQGLAECYGGTVRHAPMVMHGRTSPLTHDEDPLFAGIPQRAMVVRYHSLMVERPLPAPLKEIAWTPDGVLMGLRHRSKPHWGVQYHPESICTEGGQRLLSNFVALAEAYHARRRACAAGEESRG